MRRLSAVLKQEVRSRLFATRLGAVLGKVLARSIPVYYDPAYRLPLPAFEGKMGAEPRRADFVAWYCQAEPLLSRCVLRRPERIQYDDLLRVHTPTYLDAVNQVEELGRIFASDPTELPLDELMLSMRLGCGATLSATRWVLSKGGAAVNLHGGFHHAARAHGSGLCVWNDLAVAIAVVRSEGFSGQVVILDLDAHPPDGSADCLGADEKVFIGSLSGSDFGTLGPADVADAHHRIDETLLPEGCEDGRYLAALSSLLSRIPKPDLLMVIAGGDVLRHDRLGKLGLSLEGARARDRMIVHALPDVPTVWTPGGGYSADAWKVLAGTLLAVAADSSQRILSDYDPLRSRFANIASDLSVSSLGGADEISEEDLADLLGAPVERRRLLDYYTAEGLEYGLTRYGVLPFLRRLGYDRFRIEVRRAASGGDTMHLFGQVKDAKESLLIDCSVEKQQLGQDPVLYVHWLNLRNPQAQFSVRRPQLPGQDVPGLGIAREMVEVLGRVAARLKLHGVAYRPAYFHTAYPARHRFRFVQPERQGRFLALVRDLSYLSLLDASTALAEGRVRLCGAPYQWEADEMVYYLTPRSEDEEQIRHALAECQFTVVS
jgi:acetoin utilization deacetylase AcuC-like enzyme